jgi:DNA-3-methyladenine glycosylase II
MTTFTITPDAPFSLAAAAAFGFGPNTGRPKPEAGEMRLAFVTDDLHGQAAVHLTQRDDGTIDGMIAGSLAGGADPVAVRAQVCRILSLDHPGREWLAVGSRDPVIGELQAAHPGFRPVLFHSPYEAAAWSVISARRHRTQAAVIRTRLAQAFGASFDAGGEQADAFPTPRQLLAVGEFRGLEPARVGRLHAVAMAALDGALDPGRLAALDPGQALAELQELPGIGPTYATLILLRSAGVTDVLTLGEPLLASYAARFYSTGPEPLSPQQLDAIAGTWRPFRTWAAVLIRMAGDRRWGTVTTGPARARR